MSTIKSSVVWAAIIVGSLTVVSCAPLQQEFPILGLLIDNSPKPPALALRAVAIPSLPQYRPVSFCQYSARMTDGHTEQNMVQTLTVRKVRDRLLVTSTVGSEHSTALISQAGYRYDFNAVNGEGGRFTPETEAAGRTGEMNNIDLMIPSYVGGSISPGQIAARLSDSAGTVQAAYLYRGLSTFRGREAILLDLVRVYNGSQIGRSIGFSIVDRQRALPMQFAVGGVPTIRSEQTTCRD